MINWVILITNCVILIGVICEISHYKKLKKEMECKFMFYDELRRSTWSDININKMHLNAIETKFDLLVDELNLVYVPPYPGKATFKCKEKK